MLAGNSDGSVSFNEFVGDTKPEKGIGVEIGSSHESSGFIVIPDEPDDPSGIKVFVDEAGMQVNYLLTSGTAKVPDFKYVNDAGTHKIYFKNVDGVTGLSEDSGLFVDGSFYSIFYNAK